MSVIENALSPFDEMVAYESLLAQHGETLTTISKRLKSENSLPSELANRANIPQELRREVEDYLREKVGFTVLVHGVFQYPSRLQDADAPIAVLYAKGDLALLERPSLSIVGARAASDEGQRRAARLSKDLAGAGFVVISGLAEGIDTVALSTAIAAEGRVVGVIGTPIDEYYPRKNRALQDRIAGDHLLISQVPFFRYARQPFKTRRYYFPMRNETMAALSQGTIIVEASDQSGTHSQARACFQQGRKLFILESCFENKSITWPAFYEQKGAIRVRNTSDILEHL
jgi:DNA processing protein